MLGVPQSQISKYENDGAKIYLNDLPKLADLFEIHPCQFFLDEQERIAIEEPDADPEPSVRPLVEDHGPRRPSVSERQNEMLARFLTETMELQPEHVHAVTTLVAALPRGA